MFERPGEGFSTQKIVGMSHKVESIIRLIDQIRDCSVDVLIQGESGTGKELVARALHYNSPRANGPFVALNCAALPDNLVEAELFGIEKGVATGVERRTGKFEAANRGTLFLDEIGDLNLTAQAKLLRALQERAVDRVGTTKPIPIDIRIIAATNRDLLGAIREKQFREDLYYRVKVIRIQTPPLREITEDIPLLANHFLEKHCQAMNVESKKLHASRAAMPDGLCVARQQSAIGERGQTANRFRTRQVYNGGASGPNDSQLRQPCSCEARIHGAGAGAISYANPTRSHRLPGTPHDRRRFTKIRWQQTKSGPGLRPEPPGAD